MITEVNQTTSEEQNGQDSVNNEPVILSFQMTLENVNNLFAVLSKLPYEQVAGYINSIRSQALSQLQAKENTQNTQNTQNTTE
jgi:hypothetical protein